MQWHCLLCDIDLEMRGNNAGDLHILEGVYCATREKKGTDSGIGDNLLAPA